MRARDILLLVILTLAVRLPWAMLQPTDPQILQAQLPDQYEYLALGQNLLQHNGLWFVDPRFDQAVHAFRMPGYPAFIAAMGASPTAVRIGQILIEVGTVLGVYLLARRIFSLPRYAGDGSGRGPRPSNSDPLPSSPPGYRGREQLGYAPLVAGLLVAVNPWLVYFSGLILSETLFTAMLVWGMALPVVGRGRWWAWGAGIGLLALSVHVRPAAIPLVPVLAMAAAWVNSRSANPYEQQAQRSAWRIAGAGLVGAAAVGFVLLPWAIRNAANPQVNSWIWTTTNAGFTSYDGLHPGATGASDQTFIAQMPELQTMDEVERSAYLGDLARQSAMADPGRIARLAAIKIGRTWSPIPLSDQFGQLKYILPGLLFTIPFFGLVIVGLAGSRLSRPVKLYLLLPAVYLTAVHGLSVGSARYRIPAEAPMGVIAAAGAAAFANRRSDQPAG